MSKSSSPWGVFHTWTKWAIPQAEWAIGSAGQPKFLANRPGFEVVQPEPVEAAPPAQASPTRVEPGELVRVC
jgi:hypothetical protein